MKKLSKIDESAWGEMRKRSSGEQIRKEDEVLDNETLKNKIKQLYKEQGSGDTLDVSSLHKHKFNDLSNLFKNFNNVKQIIGLETWDVSNVINMDCMFNYCDYLTELNISNWDVSKVTNMYNMFCYCTSLTELNISNWDVSSVTDMSYMFEECSSLTELNIDNWNVSKVTYMDHMFDDCDKLIKPKWYKDE